MQSATTQHVHPHIHSVGGYLAVFVGLIVFTVITYTISLFHLGPFNLVLAILIATIKAGLVVLFFMHLKDDARFHALIFLSAVFFAVLFLAYVMNDTSTRGEVETFNGTPTNPNTGARAPGFDPDYAPEVRASGAH